MATAVPPCLVLLLNLDDSQPEQVVDEVVGGLVLFR